MRIEYQATLADILARRRFEQEHSPKGKLESYLAPAGIGMAAWAVASVGMLRPFPVPEWVALISGVMVYWAMPMVTWLVVERTKKEVMIGPEQISVRGGKRSKDIPWKQVEYVIASEEHLFAKAKIGPGLIIPRRIFASAKEWKELVQECEHYRRVAAKKLTRTEIERDFWILAYEESELYSIPSQFAECDLGTENQLSVLSEVCVSLLERGLIELCEGGARRGVPLKEAIALLRSKEAWDSESPRELCIVLTERKKGWAED